MIQKSSYHRHIMYGSAKKASNLNKYLMQYFKNTRINAKESMIEKKKKKVKHFLKCFKGKCPTLCLYIPWLFGLNLILALWKYSHGGLLKTQKDTYERIHFKHQPDQKDWCSHTLVPEAKTELLPRFIHLPFLIQQSSPFTVGVRNRS